MPTSANETAAPPIETWPAGNGLGNGYSFGAVTGLHQLLETDRQSEARDDQRDHAVTNQRIDNRVLEADAKQQHRCDARQQERDPQRCSRRHEEQYQERRHHHEFALGEIDGSCRLPKQREPKRRQPIDRAGRGTRNDELQ